MKKAALFLTSLVSLSLALSACQPADEKITDPRQENFRGFGKSKDGKDQFRLGSYALAAIAMEKEVEALQVTRLVLGVDAPTTSGYAVDATRNDGTVTITSDGQAKNYETNEGQFRTTVKKTFTATIYSIFAGGVVVDIQGSKLSQSVDRIGEKQFLNWFEKTYSLKLEPSKTAANEAILTLKSSGDMNFGNKAGKVTIGADVMITMRVDRASLKTGHIKVLETKNVLTATFGNKPLTLELVGQNHEVVNNGKCYSLNGQSTASLSSSKTQRVVTYTDSLAEVSNSNYRASAANCESRPTLDLSRTFIY